MDTSRRPHTILNGIAHAYNSCCLICIHASAAAAAAAPVVAPAAAAAGVRPVLFSARHCPPLWQARRAGYLMYNTNIKIASPHRRIAMWFETTMRDAADPKKNPQVQFARSACSSSVMNIEVRFIRCLFPFALAFRSLSHWFVVSYRFAQIWADQIIISRQPVIVLVLIYSFLYISGPVKLLVSN